LGSRTGRDKTRTSFCCIFILIGFKEVDMAEDEFSKVMAKWNSNIDQ